MLGHTTLSLGTATSSSIGQGGGSSTAAAGTTTSVAGYSYSLPAGVEEAQCLFVWVGPSDVPALQALQLSLNTAQWLRCEPADWEPSAESATASTAGPGPEPTAASTGKEAQAESAHAPAESEGAAGSTAGAPKSPVCKVEEGLAPGTQALLKRRYFLVEKAKEASIVGILVRFAAPLLDHACLSSGPAPMHTCPVLPSSRPYKAAVLTPQRPACFPRRSWPCLAHAARELPECHRHACCSCMLHPSCPQDA